MKNTSIVIRITCWYAAFLLIITLGFLLLQFELERKEAQAAARNALTEAVSDAGEYILDENSTFAISSYISFYKNDIYLSIYDENGELIEGRRPPQVTVWPVLKDKTLHQASDREKRRWYFYDNQFEMNDKMIWVRGVTRGNLVSDYFPMNFLYMILGLLSLIIIAITGGYLISRRAFVPVWSLIKTVHSVSNNDKSGLYVRYLPKDSSRKNEPDYPGHTMNHWSLKLPFDGSRDEVDMLTDEFNMMFDRLNEQQEREKQFTSDVSHELKTPLSVIISQCDYALQDSSYQEKALTVIRRNASSMSSLVNTLLLLSRGDAGKLSTVKTQVDLSMLCSIVADQQQDLLTEDQITLTTEIEPDIVIQGDETLLMMIPINLITNAHKYGKCPGGHIELSLFSRNKNIYLSVKDDGPGIPSEHKKKIFDRFYTINPSRSRSGSSGLGLAIVKMVVESHGGRIDLESVSGQGSTFIVTFPDKGADT